MKSLDLIKDSRRHSERHGNDLKKRSELVATTDLLERETEETTDKEQTNFQGSIAHIQPPVIPILKPDVLKTLPKTNITYPSRLNDQKIHKKAMNQMEKFFQIFQDLHFDISFADALLMMPKFASTIKSLLANKDKLFELAKIPLNENYSAMLLKKLPVKLGDPSKFLYHLSPPKLTPTRMTLELADQSIIHPKGVAKDVFVKVGKFYFPTDFVVVNFEADPLVPLILGRSFLRTGHALIDVYGEEIILRVNDEAKMLGFSNNFLGGNPTLTSEPIISDSSPSFTPFEGSDFILEEIEAYLKDESISPETGHVNSDPEGDIYLIEKLLNDDPFQLTPMDLKQGEVIKAKSSVEEPPDLELKDLPSNLEYAYLEGADKLLIIIAKDLKDNEKEALIKWVEAKALPINDARVVVKFLKSLFARFGTPRAIICDRETHFCNDKFAKVMSKTIGENCASWSEKLEDALCAFRTAYKTPIGCTPYKVFPYGTVELSQPEGLNFKENGHRVKHYFGRDVPQVVVPDLQTFPWTNECGDRVKLCDSGLTFNF
nr:hypothetical protein [Tanacetum cinerariifolium]